MNDLLARINALAAAKKWPDAATLNELRTAFGSQPPEVAANLHALLDNLLDNLRPGGGGGGGGAFNWKTGLALAGAVVGGGAIKTAVGDVNSPTFNWQKLVEGVTLTLHNKYELLGVIALIGAVVGIGYSVFHNGWKLVLPHVRRDAANNTLEVNRWGFLDETAFAAAAAVVTCWGATDTFDKAEFKLQGGMIVSAVTAAVIGARMRSGMQDRNLLWSALAESTVRPPAVPGTDAEVKKAPTVPAAVATAQAGAAAGS